MTYDGGVSTLTPSMRRNDARVASVVVCAAGESTVNAHTIICAHVFRSRDGDGDSPCGASQSCSVAMTARCTTVGSDVANRSVCGLATCAHAAAPPSSVSCMATNVRSSAVERSARTICSKIALITHERSSVSAQGMAPSQTIVLGPGGLVATQRCFSIRSYAPDVINRSSTSRVPRLRQYQP